MKSILTCTTLLMASAALANPAAPAEQALPQAVERILYQFEPGGNGRYFGDNFAQHLSLRFDKDGLHFLDVQSGASSALRLSSYGYALQTKAPQSPKLTARGSYIELDRGDFCEWYINSPSGLEQGFTFRNRPLSSRLGGPLMVSLAVDGNLLPSLQSGGTSVLLKMHGHPIFEYGGLHVVDATGQTIPSRMNVDNGQIRLIVDDMAAVYPLIIDPTVTWKQYSQANAPDAASTDHFGYSMSTDGNKVLVGAYNKTVNGNPGQGAAYLFYVPSFVLIQEYTAPDGAAGDNFGKSVSYFNATVVVGAPNKAINGNAAQGAIYAFWDQGTNPQIFTASDGAAGDHLGAAVATVYSDGPFQYIIAGVPERNSSQGAVYFFSGLHGDLNSWTQRSVVASDGSPGDEFGASVSLGLFTMAVGAPGKTIDNNVSQGKAYVYVLGSRTVSPVASVTAPDGAAGDRFGESVAADGSYRFMVGAPGANAAQGAAYVFSQDTKWALEAKLTAPDGAAGDNFGASVAISLPLAAVGAPGKTVAGNPGQGEAYAFRSDSAGWSLQAQLLSTDGAAGDALGASVVTVDIETIMQSAIWVMAGASSKNVSGLNSAGVAYTFTPWSYTIQSANGVPQVLDSVSVGPFARNAAGEIFFADDSNRIRKLTPGLIPTSSIVAGNGTQGFAGDGGPALNAEFNGIAGLALDAAVNIYVADANNRVRKISNGIVTTIAGNGSRSFSGDGGPATNAALAGPTMLAVASSGDVYVADTYNNRVRMISNGVITTVAGGGSNTGSNISATSAALEFPSGVALDSLGNLYISDFGNNRICRVTGGLLTVVAGTGSEGFNDGPASTAELYHPGAIALDPSGNVFFIDTGNSRVREISGGMVTTVAGNGFYGLFSNATSATVSSVNPTDLAITSNGIIYLNGNPLLSELIPASCATSISNSGQLFASSGGSGTIRVNAIPGCSWTVSGAPSWVQFTPSAGTGSAQINYTVLPNSSAQTASFNVAGAAYTVQQGDVATSGLSLLGTLTQIASGDGWDTQFTLVNKASTNAPFVLNLWDEPGTPMLLPLTLLQSAAQGPPFFASVVKETLAPGAMRLLDSQGSVGSTGLGGSGQLFVSGNIDGFATFRDLLTGQEAASPLEIRNAGSYFLPFDNAGGLSTGLAIANVSPASANIPVIIRNDVGAQVATATISLSGYGHTSFMLHSQYSSTENIRGTVEFQTPSGGRISVLGLRASPLPNSASFAITSLPVLANVVSGQGSIAQVAAGGGWQTDVALVNVGASPANFTLSFYDDHGLAWSMPLSFPQRNSSVTQSVVSETLQPGQMLLIEAPTGTSSTGGSAVLTTTGSIGAFTLFRDNLTGQEAGVPLETRAANAYLLAYDNTNGITTGVAVANTTNQAVSIPITIRDDSGNVLLTTTLNLVANGHTAFMLTDRVNGYPATQNTRGTLEFDNPGPGQIAIVGLRATPIKNNAFAITTLPPFAK